MKLITRRLARLCALQALYSWKLSQNDVKAIECYIVLIQNIQNFDISYFQKLYIGVLGCIQELEKLMIPYLQRNFKNLDYIEYFVLLIALFELTRCFDVPYKVVINEAIELTKIFGAEKSHKFINGVLDKMVSSMLYKNNAFLCKSSNQSRVFVYKN